MKVDTRTFYMGRKWKRKRMAVLRRDAYQCQDCRRYGRMRQATEVHHIKHLDEYPELAYESDNLISLCHACHNARHPEKGCQSKKYFKANSRGGGVRKISKNFG